MAQVSYLPQAEQAAEAVPAGFDWRGFISQWPVRLLALLLGLELFMPILIWRTPLPGVLDFAQEFVAAFILLLTVFYMIVRNKIPLAVLFILAVSLVWVIVATFEGQPALATAWGWWRFFKYPLIGVFAYLTVRWPVGFSNWWLKFLVVIMAFEVGVQLLQFAAGAPPNDNLAGTFGRKGVGPQTMFNMFVTCLAFGHWVVSRRWRLLAITLVLGFVSSTLNVTKFYIPAVAAIVLVTVVIYLVRGGQFRQLFVGLVVFAALGAAFVPIFNSFVATTRGLPTVQEFFEPQRLERYLYNDGSGDEDGRYNLGRALSVTYALQIIQRDGTTQLFGMGLGTRSSSSGLGITGTGLETDLYGGAAGTGLLIMIQEMGIVGLAVFSFFCLWLSWRFFRDSRQHSDTALAALQIGTVIFTLFWPVWLWYQKPWTFGVMMILYWVTIGFIFSRMHVRQRRVTGRISRATQRNTQRGERPPISPAYPRQYTNGNGHGPEERVDQPPPLL